MYDRFYKTHAECVKKGLSESHSVLYNGKLFKLSTVNTMELYPKFMCEKVEDIKKDA